jgi:hypothetical protein
MATTFTARRGGHRSDKCLKGSSFWHVAPGAVYYEGDMPQVSAEAHDRSDRPRSLLPRGMRELQDRFDGRRVADGLVIKLNL